MADHPRILIAGGGTGGHLFPALALGEQILSDKPNSSVYFMGSTFGIEAQVLPVKNLDHTLIPIRGLQRGFSPESIGKNLLLPFRILNSMRKTRRVFNRFHPDVVVGTGGYAAALPLREAVNRKIPVLIQEQNSFPGITTRWFAEKADKINLDPEKKTLLMFGGSQGSVPLNKVMRESVIDLEQYGIQVLWQTGINQYSSIRSFESASTRVLPFIDDMGSAYALSDLVFCRAGALTVSELALCGLPAFFVPLASAAGDHQQKNASVMENEGAAVVCRESELSPSVLVNKVSELMKDSNRLSEMSRKSKSLAKPDAVREITEHILELAG